MKKIFTVHDGQHWSQGAVDLACYLSRLSHAKLTGIFPGYPNNDEQTVFARVIDDTAPNTLLYKQKAASVEDAIAHFKEACLKQDVTCFIHRDNSDPGHDIITESMFADLLIVDETLSFSEADNRLPSQMMHMLITHAKCPVILSPATFTVPEEIIFAYDGTGTSMFAIKQFTYLFPEMKDKTITVIEVTNEGGIRESGRLAEWLEGNYAHVAYEVLQGDASDRLLEVVLSNQDGMLVMGAFGRNSVSTLFKHSAADSIVRFTTIPVFVAHQ